MLNKVSHLRIPEKVHFSKSYFPKLKALGICQATRCCVLVSHSSCIWDIKNLCCEKKHDPSLACVARGCSGGVSFATCSSDGTIRLWDLALQSDLSKDVTEHHPVGTGTVGLPCLGN